MIKALDSLDHILSEVARPGTAFDPNLADYVFFPLSHVFKQSQQIPERAVELAVKCLIRILETGWSRKLPVEIGIQLQILLTFIAGGNPAHKGPHRASEEVQTAAFTCLSTLFNAFRSSSEQSALTAAANVPALGHVVTVVLDGIADGASNEVQWSATSAFRSLQSCVQEMEALVSFFPGTVSTLAKVLNPSTRSKRSWRVLEGCLELLSQSLVSVLDDAQLPDSRISPELDGEDAGNEETAKESWLKATASQVKLALANVMKLRQHERAKVRRALFQLCLNILEHCRQSLSDSISLVVETMIALSGDSTEGGQFRNEVAMIHHMTTDPLVTEAVNSNLHKWIIALPRVMQSSDDTKKRMAINQLSKSFRLLADSGSKSNLMDHLLATNLRDSVTATIRASSRSGITQQQNDNVDPATALTLTNQSQHQAPSFSTILMNQSSQRETLSDLRFLLGQLSETPSALVLVKDFVASLPQASGDNLLGRMWLSLGILNHIQNRDMVLDELIDNGSTATSSLVEELYSYSLSVLMSPWKDGQEDYRVQCLALEAVALQAQRLKTEFRTELVDALYPVVHLIGSPESQLRNHAVVCLNIISRSSGYFGASDLIIDNVDYLVNAVALKLNTFDISPQAPQVLLMMIKLTGPSLLPYLDDLLGSVFAALDSYHGYPRLVELLFAVLQGIVEESTKSDTLALRSGKETDHWKTPNRPPSIAKVASQLSALKQRPLKPVEPEEPSKAVPHEPWSATSPSEEDSEAQPATASEPAAAPPGKVYQMVLGIARLTQHHLTQPSPQLRQSLLRLTATASEPLARHEDAYLPLVHDLWPVVVARLYDEQAYVVCAAADAVAAMAAAAGDFLASRVAAEWGPRLGPLLRRVRRDVLLAERRRGPPASGRAVWAALERLLVAVLEHVRVDDEIVDDVVELAKGGKLEDGTALCAALEGRNPDAVWLARREEGAREGKEKKVPHLDGFVFNAEALE